MELEQSTVIKNHMLLLTNENLLALHNLLSKNLLASHRLRLDCKIQFEVLNRKPQETSKHTNVK